MQWFFGYSGNAADWFRDMIKVAVLSAHKNTSLEPNCLYDGEGDDVVDWLSANGVKVHKVSVPFRDELFSDEVLSANQGTPYRPENATGHFLRLMVPDFSSGQRSLYTDCDVMFLQEPTDKPVETIGACDEIDVKGISSGSSFNSGVMIIDNERLSACRSDFIDFARKENFYSRSHHSYDQVLLNRYFQGQWNKLPPEMNWRPWQGISSSAQIIHFHGPKPQRVAAILEGRHLADESALLKYVESNRLAYEVYGKLFADLLLGREKPSDAAFGFDRLIAEEPPARGLNWTESVTRWGRRVINKGRNLLG